MYDFIRGTVVSLTPTHCVLDVAGVGYRFQIPVPTFERLELQVETTLLVWQLVREDKLELFGFASEPERGMFLLLLQVNGVGPSIALNILARASVGEIADAIATEQIDFLRGLKGIGPKTAARLIMELKEKVGALAASGLGTSSTTSSYADDAASALEVLGYSPKVAHRAVNEAASKTPDATIGELVRAALKHT